MDLGMLSMKRIVSSFLNWLYPDRCVFCQEIVKDCHEEYCESCISDVRIIDKSFCEKCGKLHKGDTGLCYDCRKHRHYFTQGRAMFVYDEPVKSSLFGLKFFKHTWIGRKYGLLLGRFFVEQDLWEVDMIVPVPLHYGRRIERGYNQARIIADYMSPIIDVPVSHKLLSRVKATKPQKDLSDHKRHRNLINAFKVKGDDARGKRVLLIDDIYTTGATIDGCAKVLKESGAVKVYFLTVAIGSGF